MMIFNNEEINIGDYILVKAWWLKNESHPCKIINFYGDDVLVQPTKGNPHCRSIKYINIMYKISEYEAFK